MQKQKHFTKINKKGTEKETFADRFPELVREWDSNNTYKPSELAVHSNKRVNWVCSVCGNKWETSVNNRANGGGCKKCYLRNKTSNNKRRIICVETQEIFDSISSAAMAKNIKSKSSVSNCLRGRTKSASGFTWKYLDE